MSDGVVRWVRFEREGSTGFGTLVEDRITVHQGDLFAAPRPTDEQVPLGSVGLLIPCLPTKMIGLWNNFRAAAAKHEWAEPEEPLWFLKAPSSFLDPEGVIVPPASYPGKLFFEGELGVVIGRRCRDVGEAEAESCIFGYTCVNDVTAFKIVHEDPSFPQWARAKSFDTLGPFGPVIATGLDPSRLEVRTSVNDRLRQHYPVSDMFFSPTELVTRISRDTTLLPGDIITCGTSLGARPMRSGATVEVVIEGIGILRNRVA